MEEVGTRFGIGALYGHKSRLELDELKEYAKGFGVNFIKSWPLVAMGRYALWWAKGGYKVKSDKGSSEEEGSSGYSNNLDSEELEQIEKMGKKLRLPLTAAILAGLTAVTFYSAVKYGFFDSQVSDIYIRWNLFMDYLKEVPYEAGVFSVPAVNPEDYANQLRGGGYEIWDDVTITSYQNLNEVFFNGPRNVPALDLNGHSLGDFKESFLEQMKVDGSGVGLDTHGKYLCYDYTRSLPGKPVYEYRDFPYGSGGPSNRLVPWESVAINPPLPAGSEVRFVDLGPDGKYNPDWVNAQFLKKPLHVRDQFFGYPQDLKKIDMYVGIQKLPVGDYRGAESLKMEHVVVAVKRPG